MIIRSKWKDYYDHVSHRFGVDPLCVYSRGPLSLLEFIVPDCVTGVSVGELDCDHAYSGLWLIVAGLHAISIVKQGDFVGPYRPERHERLLRRYKSLTGADVLARPRPPNEKQVKALVRTVGAPVFCLRRIKVRYPNGPKRHGALLAEVSREVPVLRDCGVASVVPAEQMWQSIYEVMTSVLRADPDKEPPRTVGNDERVLAAGFDLKTSFRHPTKL